MRKKQDRVHLTNLDLIVVNGENFKSKSMKFRKFRKMLKQYEMKSEVSVKVSKSHKALHNRSITIT